MSSACREQIAWGMISPATRAPQAPRRQTGWLGLLRWHVSVQGGATWAFSSLRPAARGSQASSLSAAPYTLHCNAGSASRLTQQQDDKGGDHQPHSAVGD